MLADDQRAGVLPWTDVIVDVQGPFTKSDSGNQYVCSYHCTGLRVPVLEAFMGLQAGWFSRAFLKCVMRVRTIPDVVRTDRGPEMTSAVMEELLAICGSRHITGAALTPRHQGLGEREHQEMIIHLMILLRAVMRAFP